MRILIATDSFPPKVDGVSIMARTVASGLAARGHRVTVLTPTKGPKTMDNVRVVRARSLPFPIYPEVRVSLPFRLARKLVDRWKPDACLVLTTGPVGIAAVAAVPAGTPLIHIYTTDIQRYLRDYHVGFLTRPYWKLLHWIIGRATVTLCPTEAVRAELEDASCTRLGIWARGVDTSLFHPSRKSFQMRTMLSGGEPHKPLVLYVGRLAREKRLLDLYEAARSLPGMRFAFVGDGPQRDQLERKFSTIPSVFTGFLHGDELASAFASADIFAFPSDTETFGQVVVQAMASGVPPVVVGGSAPAELVPPGIAGLHVAPRNPGSLAEAIQWLANNEADRTRMAEAGTAVAGTYSWDSLLEQLDCALAGDLSAVLRPTPN